MHPYRDSRITKIVLLAFFLVVVIYGYFELRGLLFGPRIDMPTGVTVVDEPMVSVHGIATHIASLSMNGGTIPVTEDGEFEEPYLLAEGYNRIVLEAKDKYGHTTKRILEIVYQPPSRPTPTNMQEYSATSTAATSSSSTLPVAL